MDLYAALVAAAEAGEKCPPDTELMDAAGVSTRPYLRPLISRLIADKLVVWDHGTNWRVVTICASGKHTAPPKGGRGAKLWTEIKRQREARNA